MEASRVSQGVACAACEGGFANILDVCTAKTSWSAAVNTPGCRHGREELVLEAEAAGALGLWWPWCCVGVCVLCVSLGCEGR
jgi:hypothetical protein